MSIRQNNELQLNWIADLLCLTVEQLIFIDETLFNKTMRWCHQVYASIDESACYQVFKMKKHCWNVLLTYMINDYLFCINIHEDWFNDETFFQWLTDKLLSLCSFFSILKSMIIMNNISIHCNAHIKKFIISHECKMYYLSFYSLNFNFIELSFNVLKIWIQQHFKKIWFHYKNTFDEFLHYAVKRSRCDKYNVENYIFEADIKVLKKDLEADTIDFD